ncbi:MAG: hypothetical protein ACK53Y_14575, partial [bacterium]
PADLQLERHRLLRVGGIELEQRRLGLREAVLTRHQGGLHPLSTILGGDRGVRQEGDRVEWPSQVASAEAPRCADPHAEEPAPQRQSRGGQETGLAPRARDRGQRNRCRGSKP